MSDEPATTPGSPTDPTASPTVANPTTATPTTASPTAATPLHPAGLSLSGRVTTRGGRPLAGATVTVLGLDGRGAGRATTNREGRYQVPAMPGGVYAVAAQLAPHRPAATLLSLSAGQAVLDLSLTGRGVLAGRVVTGLDRIALPDVPIRLIGGDGRTVATVFSGADGAYRFTEVDEGPWTVAVQSPRYREATMAATVAADAETVVDVVLEGNGTVTGQVTAPGSTPVPGSRVLLLDPTGEVRASTLTDPSGGYAFSDVPTGGYTVVVLDLTPAVGSVRVTAREATTCDLRVREQPASPPDPAASPPARLEGPEVSHVGDPVVGEGSAPPGSPRPSLAVPPSELPPLMAAPVEDASPPSLQASAAGN